MELKDYYNEVVKTAGLAGVTEDQVEEAIEILKTAGLIEDDEDQVDEEKIAAVTAVCEQFDIDGIPFEDEDEKIAAALMVVDGYEAELEKQAAPAVVRKAVLAGRKGMRGAKGAGGRYKELLTGGNQPLRADINAAANQRASGGVAGALGRLRERGAIALGRGGDAAATREARKALGAQAGTAAAGGLAGYGAYRAAKGKKD